MININEYINVPGYEMYKLKISTNEVISIKSNRILKLGTQKSGHLYCIISKKGIKKYFGIHQIVMLIKEGPCPKGMEVCHNDGNPRNNHPDNLRYDTHSNNIKDSVRHGTHPTKGKYCGDNINSKYIKQYTKEMNLIKEWSSLTEASLILNIPLSSISSCIHGRYKYAGGYIFLFS